VASLFGEGRGKQEFQLHAPTLARYSIIASWLSLKSSTGAALHKRRFHTKAGGWAGFFIKTGKNVRLPWFWQQGKRTKFHASST